jgi:hypothetical protein
VIPQDTLEALAGQLVEDTWAAGMYSVALAGIVVVILADMFVVMPADTLDKQASIVSSYSRNSGPLGLPWPLLVLHLSR